MTDWLLAHRWRVILAVTAVLATMIAGLAQLRFDTHYRAYFDADHPYLLSHDAVNEIYTPQDGVLFLLAPQQGDVFAPEVASQLVRFTEQAWTLPFSIRVDSLSNYQHTRADGDALTVEELISEYAVQDSALLEEARKIALAEPELVGKLVSERGDVAAVLVSFQMPGESFRENIDVALAARQMADQFRAENPDTQIYLSGMMMGNYAGIEVLLDDNRTLVPLMWIVIIVLLVLLFRSFSATFITLLTILLSTLAALGLCGWFGTPIAGPSSSAPIIIMTIAVADCVHILVSYFHACDQGMEKRAAIRESLRVNLAPVFLTSLTTAIGFLTLNFSDVPPFRVLGNTAAAGVGIAFLLSVVLLPVLMWTFPLASHRRDIESAGLMMPVGEHILRYRRSYFFLVGLAALALTLLAPLNEVNDQFVKYYDESREFRYSTDFADRHLSSVYDISYHLKSRDESGVFSYEYLQAVQDFEVWLLAQPEVINVQSLVGTFRRLNRSMHGDDPAWYRIPNDQQLAAQYFMLYEMSLPFGLSATNQVSFDKMASRIQITIREQTTMAMLDLEKKYSAWLKSNAPEIEAQPSSVMLMFSHIGVENARSMIVGTIFALILMSLIIGVALRSVRMGLISLAANVLPAGMAFGVWALLYGQVGLSVAVAIGMTLGIVVDNTVHLLSKFQLALQERHAKPGEALLYSFSHVGVAVLICNCVLIAGFLILAQSDFKLNSDLGMFTSLTFALALIVDFLLLPWLLLRFMQPRGRPVVEASN
ncbi:RND family transporter [Alcanivorax sp. 1008]|uniref:efflux RND transporter permease subunit n=1 Tax=Alcanivorax sp. 1008 TaxID=2816853 RepID=UPI001D3E490E|nr:MMPL family transporter [Alcanivorax sp. 1008]MCC1498329.1 MMPL family transporter [Alcanivorax sp. 1008]